MSLETSPDPTLWALALDRLELIKTSRIVGVASAVHHNVSEILKYEAAAKDIPLHVLIRAILENVANDDLFAAVLDR